MFDCHQQDLLPSCRLRGGEEHMCFAEKLEAEWITTNSGKPTVFLKVIFVLMAAIIRDGRT